MKLIVISVMIGIIGLVSEANAEVQELSKVDWWAAHGGVREDRAFICAMVTVTPDGRQGKFVIEYVRGLSLFFLRMLKPTWAIPEGSRKQITLRFGYGPVWNITAVGKGNEVRGALPISELKPFLAGFQSAGRIDINFIGGTEPEWSLATGGGGFVEADFLKCIQMVGPAKPVGPPTQP